MPSRLYCNPTPTLPSFYNSSHEESIRVRINARGCEWTQLFDKLVNKSKDHIMGMDYSNFGPGFNACVNDVATDIIIKWTKEYVENRADELYLKTVLMECINSTHLCTNVVYQQFAGSPSGAPFTTIINSVVNLVDFMFAWYEVMHTKLAPCQLWEEFWRVLYVCVYGNDLIAAVGDYTDLL